jgi:3-hydroxy acid dehydrogenase/malonic semialdehyde reductase
MTDLHNKIVFVTGASAGIGEACAHAFARAGARLLLCARRVERLDGLAESLRNEGCPAVHGFALDVRNNDAVNEAIGGLPEEWRAIDVLINNAGLSRGLDPIHEGSIEDWDEMIDTNIKGLLYVSRAVIPGMIERGGGHVINIGSIAGHEVYPKGNVYCATKHAVGAITKGMQIDLLGTHVRATTLDPGLVESEFSMVRFHGDAERASAVYNGIEPLTPADVADAALYCATRPPHVNVHEMILMPSIQANTTMVLRD